MKKRFFRLCSGPLVDRILSPGDAHYPHVSRGHGGAHVTVAIPVEAARDPEPKERTPAPSLVHIYEAFDTIDEISLEIVLCKYIGTCPPCAPATNAAAA